MSLLYASAVVPPSFTPVSWVLLAARRMRSPSLLMQVPSNWTRTVPDFPTEMARSARTTGAPRKLTETCEMGVCQTASVVVAEGPGEVGLSSSPHDDINITRPSARQLVILGLRMTHLSFSRLGDFDSDLMLGTGLRSCQREVETVCDVALTSEKRPHRMQ
jgi:hypothetical protein